MPTIDQAINWGLKKLQRAKIDTPLLETQILLARAFKKNKEYLYQYPDKKISIPVWAKFYYYILLKRKNIPTAYITGEKEFFKLKFQVNPTVLIPRPETEILVETVLKIINTDKKHPWAVADLGTGSGCIAVSICSQAPQTKIFATEQSNAALKTAFKNATKFSCATKITFLKGDFLQPLSNTHLDIIISNPPYLSKQEYLDNQAELKYEPVLALTDNKDGLSNYKKIFYQITKYAPKTPYIVLELNEYLSTQISALAKQIFPRKHITIISDLCQKPRVIVISEQPLRQEFKTNC